VDKPPEDRLRPEHKRRFIRLVRGINKLMEEVQEYEPKAFYFLADGYLNLIIEDDDDGCANQKNVAAFYVMGSSDGGGW
jgi:hypothetical protein